LAFGFERKSFVRKIQSAAFNANLYVKYSTAFDFTQAKNSYEKELQCIIKIRVNKNFQPKTTKEGSGINQTNGGVSSSNGFVLKARQ
jgi:hypothetical protein